MAGRIRWLSAVAVMAAAVLGASTGTTQAAPLTAVQTVALAAPSAQMGFSPSATVGKICSDLTAVDIELIQVG